MLKNAASTLAGTPRGSDDLEVGALMETVEVRGGTQLVNTTTPTVSSTVSVD